MTIVVEERGEVRLVGEHRACARPRSGGERARRLLFRVKVLRAVGMSAVNETAL